MKWSFRWRCDPL